MKLSYNWLQSYFKDPLPSVAEIERAISLHAFEHEETEAHENGDTMIEFDVLPNRAPDCLSHYGIAKEIAIHFNRDDFVDDWRERLDLEKAPTTMFEEGENKESNRGLSIHVENYKKCIQYMGCVIKNIQKKESPDWLKTRLETIGQRSIHNLVDATNYVMFELGQPLHVFDYAKIAQNNDGVPEIIVRDAIAGEAMTTLDNKDLEFTGGELVIADSEKILALAGVKGGKAAEVDDTTVDIVLECAHFNDTMVRDIRRKYNMMTDASKRYENRVSPWIGGEALQMVVTLIHSIAHTPDIHLGEIVQSIPTNNHGAPTRRKVTVRHENIEMLLGVTLSSDEALQIFNKIGGEVTFVDYVYAYTQPLRRRDLNIPEDIIEEIGRIHGYEHIPAQDLSDINFTPQTLSITALEYRIRQFMIAQGFSELMGYTFENKGDTELLKAMASDKNFLRTNLMNQAEHSMKQNLYFAPVYNRDEIMTFEIGRVFPGGKEERHLVMSLAYASKKAKKAGGPTGDQLNAVVQSLEEELGVNIPERAQSDAEHLEIRYDSWITDAYDTIFMHKHNDDQESLITISGTFDRDGAGHLHAFAPYSMYPFMTRDVALWVGADVSPDDVMNLIKEKTGDLALRIDQFDRFEKDDRVSYAFRIIFQSMDKTLEESDITPIMTDIQKAIEEKGWEMR